MTSHQMRDFEVHVDLSKIHYLIKGYKLKEYSKPNPIIKITAKNPDHASYLIQKNLIDILKEGFAVNHVLIRRVKEGLRITKLIPYQEEYNG